MSITIDQLVEVKLNKEDDFLKIRETLTRIGIASVKEKKLFNPATFSINKVDTTSSISKSYLIWMESLPTSLMKIEHVVTQSLILFLSGTWLTLWIHLRQAKISPH